MVIFKPGYAYRKGALERVIDKQKSIVASVSVEIQFEIKLKWHVCNEAKIEMLFLMLRTTTTKIHQRIQAQTLLLTSRARQKYWDLES